MPWTTKRKEDLVPLLVRIITSTYEAHLLVCCHDEVSPLLHCLGCADLSVGDVGWDEAQQALQQDFWAIVHVVLLGRQFCEVILCQRKRRILDSRLGFRTEGTCLEKKRRIKSQGEEKKHLYTKVSCLRREDGPCLQKRKTIPQKKRCSYAYKKKEASLEKKKTTIAIDEEGACVEEMEQHVDKKKKDQL